MKINERLIADYSKKIFGFSYQKTGSTHDAEDLSQEIMLTLWKMDLSARNIENMDAYIHRVCMYVWSNFARKNVRNWHTEQYDGLMEDAADGTDAAEDAEKNELYARLRREITYLSRTRREIMIMFYYDGLSGKEIAARLGVPDATVRWHIGKSKETIRRRMEMNDTIYRPKKLEIYFSGNTNDFSLAGLRNDLIMQNVCAACAGKPLAVEDIAAKIGVPAFYFEDKLEKMTDMGFLAKNGRGEYQTQFMIKDSRFSAMKAGFEQKTFPPVAEKLYDEISRRFDEIVGIGFSGCDLSRDKLMWTLCSRAAHDYFNIETKGDDVRWPPVPVRGDGSSYWLKVSYSPEDILSYADVDPETLDFIRFSSGTAGKHSSHRGICIQQFDPPVLTENRAIPGFCDLVTAVVNGCDDENSRELIADGVRMGYAVMEKGAPRLTFPYMDKERYGRFEAVMMEIVGSALSLREKTLHKEWREYAGNRLPAYLPDDERGFVSLSLYEPNAMTYILYKEGRLKMLSEEEKKGVCTIAFAYDPQ